MTAGRSPLPIADGILLAGDGGDGPTMQPVDYGELTMDGEEPLEEL